MNEDLSQPDPRPLVDSYATYGVGEPPLAAALGSLKRMARPHVRIFGTEYPVMRELEGEWKLIAHPNGPAIAISYDSEMGLLATLDHSHEEIPESVRTAAIGAYREISWPKMRGDCHAA